MSDDPGGAQRTEEPKFPSEAELNREVEEAGLCEGCGRPDVWWRCKCGGPC